MSTSELAVPLRGRRIRPWGNGSSLASKRDARWTDRVPPGSNRVGSVVVERQTMRKLLSVALLALAFGGWGADRRAEASYHGAASTRSCPADQDCPGHVEYQLQQCT